VWPNRRFARNAVDGKGTIWLDRQRDWLLRSKDGGHTFLAPALMSESCAKTFAMLGVDDSGSATMVPTKTSTFTIHPMAVNTGQSECGSTRIQAQPLMSVMP